ncbi:hypothetical protein DFH09DRAFT_1275734 [Mycena vulgaris]|nr:hypothetical protein DFH09DRAFT_1275734 [Mycena vulgaris]
MAAPSPTNSPVSPLNGTLGSIEIGGVVSTFLFGIVTLQVYSYYRDYPRDSRALKGFVALIWFLELGHAIATWHAVFTLSVTFYGQPAHIAAPPHSLQTTLLFSAPIYALVQIFFANRVRVLSGRSLVMIVCCFLTLLRFTCSMAMLVLTMIQGLAILQVRYRWLMAAGLSLGATVDLVIAVSMCACLWELRHSMFQRSKLVADLIMAWSIESGLATSGISFIQLFLFLTRDDLVWFPFFLVTARLFSNSLMVSLNDRHLLRSINQVVDFEVGTLWRSGAASAPTSIPIWSRPNPGLEIEMSVAVQKSYDAGCSL